MKCSSKIAILLSTYNGEQYIEEFFDSVYSSMKTPAFDILIRDDGSSDTTIDIINKYKTKYNNINTTLGNNVGSAISFMKLLYLAPLSYDYYFFADQDDYWLPDKTIKCIQILEDYKELPAMVSTDFYITDKELNIIKHHKIKNDIIGFNNSIVQNPILGATICFNNNAVKMLQSITCAITKIRMHDFWVYQILSKKGVVKHINEPLIYYRQHDNNVIGIRNKINTFKEIIYGVSIKTLDKRKTQLQELISCVKLNNLELKIAESIIEDKILSVLYFYITRKIVFSTYKRFCYFYLVMILSKINKLKFK